VPAAELDAEVEKLARQIADACARILGS